ncbi:MAG: hypothetical protein KA371_06180 [Acidobacteria bacterium]|nr:hypothetical protein [Acidobacteriota bacterium]
MAEHPGREPEYVLHQLNNQLGLVVGFCGLLVLDVADDDPKRPDLVQIERAGRAAVDLASEMSVALRDLRASLGLPLPGLASGPLD